MICTENLSFSLGRESRCSTSQYATETRTSKTTFGMLGHVGSLPQPSHHDTVSSKWIWIGAVQYAWILLHILVRELSCLKAENSLQNLVKLDRNLKCISIFWTAVYIVRLLYVNSRPSDFTVFGFKASGSLPHGFSRGDLSCSTVTSRGCSEVFWKMFLK